MWGCLDWAYNALCGCCKPINDEVEAVQSADEVLENAVGANEVLGVGPEVDAEVGMGAEIGVNAEVDEEVGAGPVYAINVIDTENFYTNMVVIGDPMPIHTAAWQHARTEGLEEPEYSGYIPDGDDLVGSNTETHIVSDNTLATNTQDEGLVVRQVPFTPNVQLPALHDLWEEDEQEHIPQGARAGLGGLQDGVEAPFSILVEVTLFMLDGYATTIQPRAIYPHDDNPFVIPNTPRTPRIPRISDSILTASVSSRLSVVLPPDENCGEFSTWRRKDNQDDDGGNGIT